MYCPNCGHKQYCGCKSCISYNSQRYNPFLPWRFGEYDTCSCGKCGFTQHIDFWEDLSMRIQTVVRYKDEFPKAFREIEGRLSQRQTRAGKNTPSKCLIVYVNINPSSMVKAYNLLKAKMEGEMFGIIQALQNGNTPNYDVFRRLDRQLMTSVQNASGHKTWLDLDFDVPDKKVAHAAYIKPLVDQLTDIKHCLVETKGGYHLLIDRASLEQNSKSLPVPLHLIVKTINDELGSMGEAVFNKNAMIPFPGFLQAGFEVRIL